MPTLFSKFNEQREKKTAMAHRYDFQFFQGIILLSVTVLYTNPTSDEYKEATKRIIYEVGLSTVVDVL